MPERNLWYELCAYQVGYWDCEPCQDCSGCRQMNEENDD